MIDKKRADWVYHVLGNDNERCLDIGSGLGNISERLSYLYDKVYSLEAVSERIEFQKRRFKNSSRSNINICRSNALKLPFEDNFFDLIVCNGVLEWIGMMNTSQEPRKAQQLFLKEMKRGTKKNGRLYIGIENRFGIQFFLGSHDHSGIPYTSLLPRFLASLIVKKFGNSGGIYGDPTQNMKEHRGYFTYTYSLSGYKSLFKSVGLKTRSYWVFPSYNQPDFTGNMEDKDGIKGFVNYIKKNHHNFNSLKFKFRLSLNIARNLPSSLLQSIVIFLSPSFLFYCYKDQFNPSLDDFITNVTTNDSFILSNEGKYLKYILFDNKNNPTKIAYVNRKIRRIPVEIKSYNKTEPDNSLVNQDCWISDWIQGKKIDPSNYNESKLAISWLIDLQNRSLKKQLSREFILNEVSIVKEKINTLKIQNNKKYNDIIASYQRYLLEHPLFIVPEHGDFWPGNILFDRKNNRIHVIDRNLIQKTAILSTI